MKILPSTALSLYDEVLNILWIMTHEGHDDTVQIKQIMFAYTVTRQRKYDVNSLLAHCW